MIATNYGGTAGIVIDATGYYDVSYSSQTSFYNIVAVTDFHGPPTCFVYNGKVFDTKKKMLEYKNKVKSQMVTYFMLMDKQRIPVTTRVIKAYGYKPPLLKIKKINKRKLHKLYLYKKLGIKCRF